jgi:hypothetical protein
MKERIAANGAHSLHHFFIAMTIDKVKEEAIETAVYVLIYIKGDDEWSKFGQKIG